ncbi:hypothetical protein ACIBK1_05785 [Microbispora rosea]|uniref:hypothetical protein n=1 Tax=Microbispora rosea TaxID=58117 RepID=UPI0037AE75D2
MHESELSNTSSNSIPETDCTDNLERLKFMFTVRSYHHNAIWEEQKHFTWLISILLSAQLVTLASTSLGTSGKIIIILAGSIVGIVLAVTAFRVQRHEGRYFRAANVAYIKEYNLLWRDSPLPMPPVKANKGILELVLSFFTGNAGVRDYFQVLWLSFITVFAGLALYVFIVL